MKIKPRTLYIIIAALFSAVAYTAWWSVATL